MKTIIVSMVAAAGLMVAGSVIAAEDYLPALVQKTENMPAVVKKYNCNACHGIEMKVVGPRFIDIAKKYKGAAKFEYKGQEYPLMEGLMLKVSKGGSGHWGVMPMPAIDPKGDRQEDMKELVTFILGLAK